MHLNLLGPNNTLVYTEVNGNVITVMDTAGNTLYQGNKLSKPGYTVTQVSPMVMDGTGSVVVGRIARQGASLDKHLYVDRLNTDGTWSNLFSTEQYANPNATDDFKYRANYDLPFIAFAKDYLYVAYCETRCSASGGMKLAKVSSPGMGIEYPRSEVFDEYLTVNGEQLDYVALGDSFSSGEGVPEFIASTHTTNNECHRSPHAYPVLLDQDVDYNVNLTGFRACSGAVMENVTTTGQYGEPAQISSLSSDTDLVTITIGGNNVEFSNIAYACNVDSGTSACINQIDESNQIAASQAFSDELFETLAEVQNAAPNANVIVNGYPYILSTPGVSTYCGWAIQAASQAEREGVEDVVDNLNSALSNHAAALGMVYIDPRPAFDGHYPCFPVPYLNEVTLTNYPHDLVYSYHPNQDGQIQYALLLDEWVD